jgi:hypothetical protein
VLPSAADMMLPEAVCALRLHRNGRVRKCKGLCLCFKLQHAPQKGCSCVDPPRPPLRTWYFGLSLANSTCRDRPKKVRADKDTLAALASSTVAKDAKQKLLRSSGMSTQTAPNSLHCCSIASRDTPTDGPTLPMNSTLVSRFVMGRYHRAFSPRGNTHICQCQCQEPCSTCARRWRCNGNATPVSKMYTHKNVLQYLGTCLQLLATVWRWAFTDVYRRSDAPPI